MITIIHNWLKARRKKLAERAYRRGYNWAAGEMLRGATPAQIESAVYCEDDTPLQQSFARGANAAVTKLVLLGFCVDDRVGI